MNVTPHGRRFRDRAILVGFEARDAEVWVIGGRGVDALLGEQT